MIARTMMKVAPRVCPLAFHVSYSTILRFNSPYYNTVSPNSMQQTLNLQHIKLDKVANKK